MAALITAVILIFSVTFVAIFFGYLANEKQPFSKLGFALIIMWYVVIITGLAEFLSRLPL